MENANCLMLAADLILGVDLEFVINEEDLNEDGIEKESHITVFYGTGDEVDRKKVLPDIKEALGDEEYERLMIFLKKAPEFSIYDVLGLDKFENNKFDVLVLKLKPGNSLFRLLRIINKSLMNRYSLHTDYPDYTPHLTLAYLKPGLADKYLVNTKLDKVLKKAKVSFQDFTISYGFEEPYRKYDLTQYHNIERHLNYERYLKDKDRFEL